MRIGFASVVRATCSPASVLAPAVAAAVGTFTATAVLAVQQTTTDTTPGAAIVDGAINAGEYVSGGIAGINSGFGNVLGSGARLFLDSSSSGTLTIGLRKGPGSFDGVAVMYLDAAAGGQTNLNLITDNSTRGRAAITGKGQAGDTSNIAFAPEFGADFAVAIDWSVGASADLYAIGAPGTPQFIASGGIAPSSSSASTAEREFAFTLAQLGLSPGDSFDYVVTYLNPSNAFRSDEFIGISAYLGGNPGSGGNMATLAAGDFNRFISVSATVPEPTTALLLGVGTIAPHLLRRTRFDATLPGDHP